MKEVTVAEFPYLNGFISVDMFSAGGIGKRQPTFIALALNEKKECIGWSSEVEDITVAIKSAMTDIEMRAAIKQMNKGLRKVSLKNL